MHVFPRFASCVLALSAVQAVVLDRSKSNQCAPYKCILDWPEAPVWCASQSKAHSTCTQTTTATARTPTCTRTANQVTTATVTASIAVTTTVQLTSTVTNTIITTTTVDGAPPDIYSTCTHVLYTAAKRAVGPAPRHKRDTEWRRPVQPPSCLRGLSRSQCEQACQCRGCHGLGCGSTVTQTHTVVKPATSCATTTHVSTVTITVPSTVTITAVSTVTTVTTSTSTETTAAEPTSRFYIQAQLSTDPSGSASGFLGSTTDPNPIVDLEPFSASLETWTEYAGFIQAAGSMNSEADSSMIWGIDASASSSLIHTLVSPLYEVITCSVTDCILSCSGPQLSGTISNTVSLDTDDNNVVFSNDADLTQFPRITMHIVTYDALA